MSNELARKADRLADDIKDYIEVKRDTIGRTIFVESRTRDIGETLAKLIDLRGRMEGSQIDWEDQEWLTMKQHKPTYQFSYWLIKLIDSYLENPERRPTAATAESQANKARPNLP